VRGPERFARDGPRLGTVLEGRAAAFSSAKDEISGQRLSHYRHRSERERSTEMLKSREREAGSIPGGCYEILIDFTTDLAHAEVLPDAVDTCLKDLGRRAVTVLREPGPLTRLGDSQLMRLHCGLHWVVLRFFVDAASSDFEPDGLNDALVLIEALLEEPIRELFPSIVMRNTRIVYRPRMGWL
jgi:hypothetical protein